MAECVMEQRQERKEEGRQGEGRGEGKPAQALILSAPPSPEWYHTWARSSSLS